jgi:hypothetical protein
MFYFSREIMFCGREYYALSEGTRAQLTFQQFVALKNPRWRKEEVTYWVNITEENCNVPILGHYNITTFQSVMPTRVAR